jgi:CheY-like chemotaxis protein
MPQILLITPKKDSANPVVELAQSRGLHVTITKSFEEAIFLSEEKFKAILADATLAWQQHLHMSRLLWEESPESSYIAFSLTEKPQANIVRLKDSGIPVITQPNAEEQLVQCLEQQMPLTKGGLNPDILLVERLETPRKILLRLLNGLGYHCLATGSGEEAWQMLNEESSRCCVVITELMTLDIDGHNLIERVRSTPRFTDLPIIVLSAHGTAKKLWDCLIGGASGFIVKPPHRELVISELGRARRIWAGLEETRLVQPEDAENVKQVMIQHGFFETN